MEKIQEGTRRFIYDDHDSNYEQLLHRACLPSLEGAVVADWLSSWFAGREVRGSIPASPLEFQRFVISCFQVAIWLKYR